MTFLHPPSDSTAFILSVYSHHFSVMISLSLFVTDMITLLARCPNNVYWKMHLFFFFWYTVIRMWYLYLQFQNTVVGLVWEKNVQKVSKTLLLILHGACPPLHLRCACRGSHWSAVTRAVSSESLSVPLPDGPLCHNDRICCFALWSIKIWEVYSSRRPIHSRVLSLVIYGLMSRSDKATGSSRRWSRQCSGNPAGNGIKAPTDKLQWGIKNHSRRGFFQRRPILRGVSGRC